MTLAQLQEQLATLETGMLARMLAWMLAWMLARMDFLTEHTYVGPRSWLASPQAARKESIHSPDALLLLLPMHAAAHACCCPCMLLPMHAASRPGTATRPTCSRREGPPSERMLSPPETPMQTCCCPCLPMQRQASVSSLPPPGARASRVPPPPRTRLVTVSLSPLPPSVQTRPEPSPHSLASAAATPAAMQSLRPLPCSFLQLPLAPGFCASSPQQSVQAGSSNGQPGRCQAGSCAALPCGKPCCRRVDARQAVQASSTGRQAGVPPMLAEG